MILLRKDVFSQECFLQFTIWYKRNSEELDVFLTVHNSSLITLQELQ